MATYAPGKGDRNKTKLRICFVDLTVNNKGCKNNNNQVNRGCCSKSSMELCEASLKWRRNQIVL